MRLVLAAAALALMGVALLNLDQRRAHRLPDDGVTWGDAAAGVTAQRVAPEGPGAKAGIRAGDTLNRLNGASVTRAVQVPQMLERVGAWRTATYSIVRNGVGIEKPVIVGARSLNSASYYFQWVLGFAYLAIGAVVLWRRPGAPMAVHFSLFCLWSFALYAFSYTGKLDGLDRFVYWTDVWATLLAPALFLHFCLIFPGSGRASRASRLLAALAYLPAGLLLAVHHLAAAGALETNIPLVQLRFLLDRLDYGLLGAYFVLGAVWLQVAGSRSEDLVLRQQRKWLSAGTLWGIVPFVVFYIWPYVGGETPGPARSLSVFSLGLIPLAFAYAIAKYRLMDVELVLRRSAAYGLATAVLLAVFYGGLFALTGVFDLGLEGLAPAIWAVSLLSAALLFHPLRNRIQQALDRRVYRERYDSRSTLVDFAAELSTETDFEKMLSSVTERLGRTLDLSRMAVFLGGGSEPKPAFSLAAGRGFPERAAGGEAEIDLSFLARPSTTNGSRHFLYFEKPAEPSGYSGSARRTIAELDLNYYVPCKVRGHTVAYLGLGRTNHGDYLTSDDLALVQAISGYVAIAVENSRLYESLRKKAGEFERLKEYSENIVESLSVGILAADLDDRVESWNTQLELMFGISRQQAVGRRLADLLPAGLAAEFDRVREESGLHNIYKFRLRADDFPAEFRPAAGPNGSEPPVKDQERMVNVVVAPLVAKNFDRIGRLIIFDDVTERVELEEQLIQADKLSSIGLLAAGVAHEVNTPLAVISNYAQMLARQFSGEPRQAKMLEKITSQTFRASEIVNGLLNFSRTSSREFTTLSLSETIRDTLSFLEPQLRHTGIEARTEFDPEADPVRGNAGRLQQVFLNLFLNARDAMPEGGRLSVRTQTAEADEGEAVARIWVSDSGPGIKAEHLKRIFDPFFTTKGPKRGTGLGLAITYGIVQEHSGTIRVESAPGQGTSFCVELPLARKPAHAQL